MSSWDEDIFADEVNVDFLDELADLEDEEIVAAVDDACALAVSGEEQIWAGAPFSAGEVVEDYPFIRDLAGSGSENLNEHALELLEEVEEDYDLEPFIEALS